jgi:hypothetical protein
LLRRAKAAEALAEVFAALVGIIVLVTMTNGGEFNPHVHGTTSPARSFLASLGSTHSASTG